MSPVTLVRFVFSVLFLISHSANASSVGWSHDGLDASLLSSDLGPNTAGPATAASTRAGAAPTIPGYTSAVTVSNLQFGSSIVNNVAGDTRVSSTYPTGKPLAFATASLGGSSISPLCIVAAADPPPSVTPEPSSAILLGLGWQRSRA